MAKTREERSDVREQGEHGWHDIDASADTFGNGNGVGPLGYKYSGLIAIGGAATFTALNERGYDNDAKNLVEAPLDQGVYTPGLFTDSDASTPFTVDSGVVRCFIAYEYVVSQ